MKKIFFLLLTFITLSVNMFADSFISEYMGNKFVVVTHNDGTAQLGEKDESALDHNPSISYVGEVLLPDSITYNGKNYILNTISQYYFNGQSQMTKLIIPDSYSDIGHNVINGCTSLKEISLGKSIKRIFKGGIDGGHNIDNLIFNNSELFFEYNKDNKHGALTGLEDNLKRVFCFDKEPKDVISTDYVNGKYITPYYDPFVKIGKTAILYVPMGTKNIYKEKFGWKDFERIVEILVLDENDSIRYDKEITEDDSVAVYFYRSISKNKWNTFSSPLTFKQDEIKNLFGNDAMVLEFNPLSNHNVLRFTEVKNIDPNVPYIIKSSKSWVSQFFEMRDVAKPEPKTINGNVFNFAAVYNVGYVPDGKWFLNGNNFYRSRGMNKIKGFRSILGLNVPNNNAKPMSFIIGGTTDITEALAEIEKKENSIYSLNGVKVPNNSTLKKGIYIIKNKKVIIR